MANLADQPIARLKDERGEIVNIASGDFKAVQMIFSKAGSVRSCHYHKRGGHWLYVVAGRMIYREVAVTSDINPPWDLVREVKQGEKIWSGPLMIHKTEFPEDTVLISCAITPLDTESYENDTVRDPLRR